MSPEDEARARRIAKLGAVTVAHGATPDEARTALDKIRVLEARQMPPVRPTPPVTQGTWSPLSPVHVKEWELLLARITRKRRVTGDTRMKPRVSSDDP